MFEAPVELSLTGSPNFSALTFDAADERVYGFDNTAKKIYKLDLSPTAAVSSASVYSTAATTSNSIDAIAVSNGRVTIVGADGELQTTNSLSGGGSLTTWSVRNSLECTPIRAMKRVSTDESFAVGDNGLALKRTSDGIWRIMGIGTTTDLNEVDSLDGKVLIVGNDGYAYRFDEYLSVRVPLMTANGMTVQQQLPGSDLHGIAIEGTKTYIVGTNSTVLYSPNPLTNAFLTTTQQYGTDFYGVSIPTGQPGSIRRAVVSGSDSKMHRFNGVSGTQQKGVFSERINDVHFADLSTGTLAGDNFFVRQTFDGGETWQVVRAGDSVGYHLILRPNQVWTKPNGFALIGFDGFLSAVTDGEAFFQTDFPGDTVNDLRFAANSAHRGYAAMSDGIVYKIDLTPAGSNSYTVAFAAHTTAAAAETNAIHVFENGNIMAVGPENLVAQWNGSSWTDFSPTATTDAVFNDVFFHDDVVGYVVGDSGRFLRTQNVSFHPSTHAITSMGLQLLPVLDRIVGDHEEVDINAIAFGSRFEGVWGGTYTSSIPAADQQHTAYVRLLTDESDEWSSRFFYDRLGRIVVSQNSRQYDAQEYSYVLYDPLGRVYEAGVKAENSDPDSAFTMIFGAPVGGVIVPSVVDDDRLAAWLEQDAELTRTEVTRSYYDSTWITGLPITFDPNALTQRKRITHVSYEAVYDADDQTFDHATHYDYDIHGNVKTLLQDNRKLSLLDANIADQRFKRIDYSYDLVSGNVHRVDYETGNADQWHQAYLYDADNRITDAYSTQTTPMLDPGTGELAAHNEMEATPYWEKEAFYKYYQHGPLARAEVGNEQVQGVDYVYTLQGWIKGVNSNTLSAERDPGEDGEISSANELVARDAYGYSLHYFGTDYDQVGGGGNAFVADQTGNGMLSSSNDLYNGNIARMVTTITNPDTKKILPLGNAYLYDQLNRLMVNTTFNNLDLATNDWGSGGTTKWLNSFNYDANGNITYQDRSDSTSVLFDEMEYKYHKANGKTVRNRLYHVDDNAGIGLKADDIDDQGTFVTSSVNINKYNNYSYDKVGRLVQDSTEHIDTILWVV